MTTIKDRLLKKFQSLKYRHAYMDEFTDAYIATQIKVLREQQELTQIQLAAKAGMKQSQISELEDVNHRGWKVRTLKKIAAALDLVLVVRFESFGRVLPDIGHLDRQRLERTQFKNDPVFSPVTAETSNEGAAISKKPAGTLLNASARFSNQLDAQLRDITQVPNVA